MATKLTKPVTRALKVKDANNNEGEICVTMTGDGIQFWKGRRKLNVIPWAEIGKLSTLPPNGPAKFAGDNLGWLVELSKDEEIPATGKMTDAGLTHGDFPEGSLPTSPVV
jgi:hypothetical protein